MQMKKDDIKKYKGLAQYVSVQIPRVAEMKNIMSTIKRLAGKIDNQKLKDALAWGKGPTVLIVPNLVCGSVTGALGCYRSGKDNLEILESMVIEFQNGKGLRRTKSGKLVYLVGVTLLHELVHWADDQDGVDDGVRAGEDEHEGNAFEVAMYGQVIV